MSEASRLREQICHLGASFHARGYTHAATGNLSARLSSGELLVTPTGRSIGELDPAEITLLDQNGRLLSGLAPTKELPLHTALYDTRADTGAVVHLHSVHSVAWSLLPGHDADDLLPPLTSYSVMKLGRVKLLPFFVPGDAAIGTAIRALAGTRSAIVLANHGPVVAGKDLETAGFALEELEATAELTLLTLDRQPKVMTPAQIAALSERA